MVVVVDDDPIQRRLLKNAVERFGHVAHLAENEALSDDDIAEIERLLRAGDDQQLLDGRGALEVTPLSEHFNPQVGAVFSADIAVPAHDGELRFYSSVLTTGESPLWQDDLMNNLGIPIIGLGARTAAHEALPLQWMPHIMVADVGASAARAVELGGRILMQSPAGTASPWAVLMDRDGAAFGIIPIVVDVPKPETRQDAPAAPGRIGWLDLTVPDAAAARDFYRDVIGWTVQELEMNDAGARYADYIMLNGAGAPAAGICHARGTNLGLPPVWMIYVTVADMGESLQRVEERGGSIIKSSKDKDGMHMYAAVSDPVGAAFALMPG